MSVIYEQSVCSFQSEGEEGDGYVGPNHGYWYDRNNKPYSNKTIANRYRNDRFLGIGEEPNDEQLMDSFIDGVESNRDGFWNKFHGHQDNEFLNRYYNVPMSKMEIIRFCTIESEPKSDFRRNTKRTSPSTPSRKKRKYNIKIRKTQKMKKRRRKYKKAISKPRLNLKPVIFGGIEKEQNGEDLHIFDKTQYETYQNPPIYDDMDGWNGYEHHENNKNKNRNTERNRERMERNTEINGKYDGIIGIRDNKMEITQKRGKKEKKEKKENRTKREKKEKRRKTAKKNGNNNYPKWNLRNFMEDLENDIEYDVKQQLDLYDFKKKREKRLSEMKFQSEFKMDSDFEMIEIENYDDDDSKYY